ncbi:MAG TPA: hypothetical protein VFP50_07790 [Anaeromyxobacteraceae bacterium]|nr:hypothetical protein [Anaeromyxobacteraceae bacterium]
MNKRIALPLAGIAAAAVVAAAAYAWHRPKVAARKKDARPPVALSIASVPPEPSIWLDVHSPEKAWRALRTNPWLARAASEPLGQGMTTGWAGFLSTRGGDMADAFPGVVLDVVAGKLLADPFRVVFFSGPSATGTPAVVVPRPSPAADSAFDLLDGLARNGSYSATHCPGAKEPPPTPAGQPAPPPAMIVSRWLVAEHAVFAARQDGRIVLAKSPATVVQALCAAPPEVPAAQGIDLSLSFAREALGREAQLAANLLGLGPAPRLAFAIEGDRLEPRGILGDLAEPGRLDRAAPPEGLLKLIPADAGVVVLATLRLPEKLTQDSLRQHLEKSYQGAYAPRTVAVVWNPRGVERLPTEVAVAWPDRDAGLVREAFSGPNRMERRRECGHEVFASTGALGVALQRACEGKAPSLLNAPPAVTDGLRAPTSFGVGANLGVLLARLLGDAWTEEATAQHKVSPDVEAARRLLEELPFLGLRGVVDGRSLVPGGFRS